MAVGSVGGKVIKYAFPNLKFPASWPSLVDPRPRRDLWLFAEHFIHNRKVNLSTRFVHGLELRDMVP